MQVSQQETSLQGSKPIATTLALHVIFPNLKESSMSDMSMCPDTVHDIDGLDDCANKQCHPQAPDVTVSSIILCPDGLSCTDAHVPGI